MVARGCGSSRTVGGIYLETEFSPWGQPLEYFIIDSPVHELDGRPVMEALNLTPRGVQVLEHGNGVHHVFDYVGSEFYPDVLDFFEETRVLGASRRCELPASEYVKLTPGSRMVLIHPKAGIINHQDYYAPGQDLVSYPKQKPEHMAEAVVDAERGAIGAAYHAPGEHCARLWWHDLTPRAKDDNSIVTAYEGVAAVKRTLPCGSEFGGYYRHPDIKPEYAPALFLSLPIARVVLVDPERKHEKKLKKLEGLQMPVNVVDE